MDEDPSVLYLIKSYGELPTGPRSPTFDCLFFWGRLFTPLGVFFWLVSNFDYLLFLSFSLYLVQCTIVFFETTQEYCQKMWDSHVQMGSVKP